MNESGGTAPIARINLPGLQMAGKTGSSQVRRVTREQREHGYNSAKLPWEFRPHALFVCYAPYDAPRYAVAVVVEHGGGGSRPQAALGVQASQIRAITSSKKTFRKPHLEGSSQPNAVIFCIHGANLPRVGFGIGRR